jgi:hypothetical protein
LLAILAPVLPPIVTAGRMATPDALSAFCVFTVLLLLFKRRHLFLVSFFLTMAVLVRHDNLLLVLPVAAFLCHRALKEKAIGSLMRLSWMIPPLTAFIVIFYSVEHHGWSTLFHHTFLEQLAFPAQANVKIDLLTYIHVFFWGLRDVILDDKTVFFVLLNIAAIILALSTKTRNESKNELSVLSISAMIWAYHALHFILFPRMWERFFAGSYLFIFYLFVYAVAQALENKKHSNADNALMNEKQKPEPLPTTT